MYRTLMYVGNLSNCGNSICSRVSYETIHQFLRQTHRYFYEVASI
jgi:hypothetical protein